ncbi:MAG: NAD-dependent epimerase/dehydratase family protein [Methanomassiliicoccales archaeon]|jgi:CDP-paratose 2-epimerase|nr:NAD-dependent epimerase/dehydratase family protein [Methanomassiliicoccales archaeon]
MKVVVTGGAGFIGSHASEYFAIKGHEVVAFDNLSRARLLRKRNRFVDYNWKYLSSFENIKLIDGDVRVAKEISGVCGDADLIVHTAAQTAVTTSLLDPRTDFRVNLLGTFNVLEAARKAKSNPTVIFTSTNKVYGSNVNMLPIIEKEKRYDFADEGRSGVDETLSIDGCEHTPYGCSKLAADIYVQDYAQTYGVRTAVFRMSCIYGTRQFGVEDQGWVAWFIIAHLTGRKITIYGDGKQTRDILFVEDLVRAFDYFMNRGPKHGVYNIGGGKENTVSLIELIDLIERRSGRRFDMVFSSWRPGDQKVYISDISKARSEFDWQPLIGVKEGVNRVYDWVESNKHLFV